MTIEDEIHSGFWNVFSEFTLHTVQKPQNQTIFILRWKSKIKVKLQAVYTADSFSSCIMKGPSSRTLWTWYWNSSYCSSSKKCLGQVSAFCVSEMILSREVKTAGKQADLMDAQISLNTRWFKYDRDKLWLVYTQIVPVIFESPCNSTRPVYCYHFIQRPKNNSVFPKQCQVIWVKCLIITYIFPDVLRAHSAFMFWNKQSKTGTLNSKI
jgi:hypothetical protein